MKNFLFLFLVGLTTSLYAEWSDKVTFNGYFNFEFEDRIAGDEHWRSDEYQSFDSDMFDLVINVQATDRLRVAVDLSWEHGSQSEVDKGNIGYEYAFAEYTLYDSLKFRAGKMFTPFGIYNEIHTAKPSTIILKEPNPTNKMYFISSDTYEQTLLYPRWGTGIAMLGDTEIADMSLDYIVQVTNGDLSYGVGANEYDKDDNDHKAISARVRLDITDNLQVGASFHHDTMTNYAKEYKSKTVTDTKGEVTQYVTKEYSAIGKMDVDSQGLQMILHLGDKFRFEAEYMRGTLDVDTMASFARSGYSLVPSYYITDNINLYFLYAQADPNHSKEDDGATNYAPGINIEVDDNMFIKTEIFTVDSEINNTLFEGKSYSEFRAALAIGF